MALQRVAWTCRVASGKGLLFLRVLDYGGFREAGFVSDVVCLQVFGSTDLEADRIQDIRVSFRCLVWRTRQLPCPVQAPYSNASTLSLYAQFIKFSRLIIGLYERLCTATFFITHSKFKAQVSQPLCDHTRFLLRFKPCKKKILIQIGIVHVWCETGTNKISAE